MNNTTPTQPVPFDRLRADLLKLYAPPLKRPKTEDIIRQVLDELGETCQTVDQLEPVAIAEWLATNKHRAARTRLKLLTALRTICRYAAFKGWIATNPFSFRGPSEWISADELVSEPLKRHRSAEEIAAVLHQADAEAAGGDWHARRLRAFVHLLAHTGTHDSEARGLRVADVNIPMRLIIVATHQRRRLKTKARAAHVPIAEPLARVLEGWIPDTGCDWLFPGSRRSGPWTGGPPGYRPLDRVKQLGERAGVPGLTILAFRHSFATLAESWGLGELELQRILRHARPATQRHYRHHDAELLRTAAAKVHFPRPSPPLPEAIATPSTSPGA